MIYLSQYSHFYHLNLKDIIFIVIFVSSLIALTCGWFLGVKSGDQRGWFDAPLLKAIVDERILTNVRDDIANHALNDAVMHKADGRIYIAQKNGMVHRYDPLTQLWSSEQPFSETDPIDHDFVMFRSG